ncbi:MULTISPECIES: RNA degradosome polyphosphate kinase [Glutamicibacter]|uniref:Polyphosphate kinase n=2 Tax=Glutamicibacter TaxID=1742989 RepID=A0ABV9MMX6_9MICC|nr:MULTISPECIES: RNA degradosome polyphosphate kinase [Glutamicibacter]PCC32561.1 RNA degradosome polyphosphate kinase [Glutamicibacter sp. BW77]GGJ58505.1 polyphosphate kinase [Glutamicibacter ardleyensis]HBV08978.1 RNA degradosome polyphosphate kinase [Micrococcaceae bacterium]
MTTTPKQPASQLRDVPASKMNEDRIEPAIKSPVRHPEGDFNNERFLDRELSWLHFNARVLELAEDASLPLLERVNFLSIFGSNLDEFFMVRVAGLKRRIATGMAVPAANSMNPVDQLELLLNSAHELQTRHAMVFADQVRPALAEEGIRITRWDELGDTERETLSAWFVSQVFPVLTPLAVDPAHPFPYISGLSLNLAVVVRNPLTGKELFARLKVPDTIARLVGIDGVKAAHSSQRTARFIPLEALIAVHLDLLFPGMEIVEHHFFRVTRNEDLEVEEDDAENLLQALEKELLRRRFGPPVRLEVVDDVNPQILELLVRELNIEDDEVFRLPAPLDLRGLGVIASLDRTELHYTKHVGHTSRFLNESETAKAANVFGAVRRRDILLHHPYDSFSTSVQAFLEQAAADPKVMAIKQTLYRTSGDSPIVDALIDAAEAGKQVLALVEIKARFDEQANISWARKLEQAGVHVVYGIVGLKTHSKLSLVVRKEGDKLRRYCHIGTGNYHPRTARYYEDFGLLTCDEAVGEDVSRLFNQLSGYAPRSTYHRLLVAPRTVRTGLLELIEKEISSAAEGKDASVYIKVNSMVDEAIIDALYRASQAGVKVNVIVRGICALRPGLPGLSENIEVRSILGRFLEHSRVFVFANSGDPLVYIGSADMMHRNLDRRVEALVSLRDQEDIDTMTGLMKRYMDDSTMSWHLGPDGAWTRHHRDADGNPLTDIQFWLMEEHARRRMSGLHN